MAGIIALAGLDQPPARCSIGGAVCYPALFGHWLLSYAFVDRVQPPAPVSCDQVGLEFSGKGHYSESITDREMELAVYT
jgi:hypothetical protein